MTQTTQNTLETQAIVNKTDTIIDDAQILIEEATRLHDDWILMIKAQRNWTLAKIHEEFD